MHRRAILVAAALGTLLVVPAAKAAEEEALNLEQEITVISASKSEQKLSRAPAKIVIITGEQIRRRGYTDLEEVLHDLAGFDFDKAMGVEWSTIFMRGIRSDNSDRFLLIWDGVIQNDVWKQSVWLSRQYPLSLIDRIEVMYGPASLAWGANAFAGIINVILKKEADLDGVSLWGLGGSFGTTMEEIAFGKEVGNFRLMAIGRYFASDEMDFDGKYWVDRAGRRRYYDHPRDLMAPEDPDSDLEDRDGDGFYDVLLDGAPTRFDGKVDNHDREWFWEVGVGYGDLSLRALSWSRDEADDLWYTSQTRRRGRWIPTGSAVTLSYDHQFSSSWKGRAYVLTRTSGIDDDTHEPSFKARFTGDPEGPEELRIYKLGKYMWSRLFAREYRAGAQANYASGSLQGVAGIELTRTDNPEDYSTRFSASEPWREGDRHVERNAALFGNVDARITDRFQLSAGLRYDRNDVAGERGGFGDLLTPRAAAIFAPRDGHVLKLIYGQSFQAPAAFQKFSTDPGVRDLPAPDLLPEKMQSVELNYQLNLPRRLTNTFSAFFTQIANRIALQNVPYGEGTTNTFKNTGSLEVQGIEWEGRYTFRGESSAFANLSATSARDPESGRKTGDIAPFKANAGVEAALWKGFRIYARGHYVSARDTVNFDSASIYVAPRVDSYAAADLALSWLDAARGLDVTISLYNLFDATYYDPGPRSADGKKYNGAIIQEPRHGFVHVRYRF